MADLFSPTTSLTGNNNPTIFRGRNFVLRGGGGGNSYFEIFAGNKNLNENYNLDTAGFKLTGTLAYTITQDVITGTGTTFKSQLHLGQKILVGDQVFVVGEIVSDTSFISLRGATGSATTQTGFRLPQLFEINKKRGVLLTGSAVELEKGHLVAVGSGVLYINGIALPGSSLTATKNPQAAIYRPTTNDYQIRALGFAAAPPPPVINGTSGGTKAMADGKYSFMCAYWSATPEGTDGFSNPCEVVKLDGAAAPIEINLAGGKTRFEFDFTTSLASMPANATGFIIYGSQSGKKTVAVSGATTTITSPNETNYENGTWLEARKVKVSELDGSDKITIEYLDSELGKEVSGNNDPPPPCEFVAKLEGKPIYISAYGRSTTTDPGGANPGPSCVVSKFSNPDAAPAEWSASVGGNIIGFFEGVGRMFVMTPSSLDFIVSTGLIGASFGLTQGVELPIISRPYWKTGATNRYSIILIDDTLYGFSGNKLFKSIGNGDENVEKYDFGSPVEDITRSWNAGSVFTVHDSKNNNVCFVYSASHKNAQGYWCSRILPYSLFRGAWLPEIVLSETDRDMIVSGVSSIGERFEFLAGGRVSDGTFQTRTYRFDDGTPTTPIDAYLLWQPSDDGLEDRSKEIKSVRPIGKFTSMQIQIHGVKPGGTLLVTDMENGTNALITKTFTNSTQVTRYLKNRFRLKNLAMYAVRISDSWAGSGIPDRIEEIVIEIGAHGRRR